MTKNVFQEPGGISKRIPAVWLPFSWDFLEIDPCRIKAWEEIYHLNMSSLQMGIDDRKFFLPTRVFELQKYIDKRKISIEIYLGNTRQKKIIYVTAKNYPNKTSARTLTRRESIEKAENFFIRFLIIG